MAIAFAFSVEACETTVPTPLMAWTVMLCVVVINVLIAVKLAVSDTFRVLTAATTHPSQRACALVAMRKPPTAAADRIVRRTLWVFMGLQSRAGSAILATSERAAKLVPDRAAAGGRAADGYLRHGRAASDGTNGAVDLPDPLVDRAVDLLHPLATRGVDLAGRDVADFVAH